MAMATTCRAGRFVGLAFSSRMFFPTFLPPGTYFLSPFGGFIGGFIGGFLDGWPGREG